MRSASLRSGPPCVLLSGWRQQLVSRSEACSEQLPKLEESALAKAKQPRHTVGAPGSMRSLYQILLAIQACCTARRLQLRAWRKYHDGIWYYHLSDMDI